MISQRDRLINQLMSKIYPDSLDPTTLKLDIENIIHILVEHGRYNFIYREFEETLEKKLNAELAEIPDGLPSNTMGKFQIANAILNLAELMHIPKEKIDAYNKQKDKEYRERVASLQKAEEEAKGTAASLNFVKDIDVRALRSFIEDNLNK